MKLVKPTDGHRYLVVSFWGVETERNFFGSEDEARRRAKLDAVNGADVQLCRVISEFPHGDVTDEARAHGAKAVR